jgi:hypothetical protein
VGASLCTVTANNLGEKKSVIRKRLLNMAKLSKPQKIKNQNPGANLFKCCWKNMKNAFPTI